jgi:alkylhydroperoxidase family enzyme
MTWIKTVPPDQAPPELKAVYEAVNRLYPADYGPPVPALLRPGGGADSVTAAHSLIPEAMRHAMSAFGALLAPELPLSRRQQEMIATVVSAHNRCFY